MNRLRAPHRDRTVTKIVVRITHSNRRAALAVHDLTAVIGRPKLRTAKSIQNLNTVVIVAKTNSARRSPGGTIYRWMIERQDFARTRNGGWTRSRRGCRTRRWRGAWRRRWTSAGRRGTEFIRTARALHIYRNIPPGLARCRAWTRNR